VTIDDRGRIVRPTFEMHYPDAKTSDTHSVAPAFASAIARIYQQRPQYLSYYRCAQNFATYCACSRKLLVAFELESKVRLTVTLKLTHHYSLLSQPVVK